MVSLPPLWFSFQPFTFLPFKRATVNPSPTCGPRIVRPLPRARRRSSQDTSMSESSSSQPSSSSNDGPRLQAERDLSICEGVPTDPNYIECIDGPLSPGCDDEENIAVPSELDRSDPNYVEAIDGPLSPEQEESEESIAIPLELDPSDPNYVDSIDGPLSPQSDYDDEDAERDDVLCPLPEPLAKGPVKSNSSNPYLQRPHTPEPTNQNSRHPLTSTPSRQSLEAHPKTKDGTYSNRTVIDYIRLHFSPMIHRDYPITDFVRNIWHYKQKIPPGEYSIPIEYVKGYCDADGDDHELTGERASCVWLNKILTHLHDALPGNPSYDGKFINVEDRTVEGLFAKFKPDGSYSEETNIDEQKWDAMGAFDEVKHQRTIAYKCNARTKVLSIDVSRIASSEGSKESSKLKRKRSMRAVKDDPVIPKRQRSEESVISTVSLSKDQRTSQSKAPVTSETAVADVTGNVGEHSFTDHEVQAVKYANELISHGVRNYSTGILFDHANISFWYIDRMGVIKSKPFN
ncbi:hypothetical protein ABKN59_011521, partial [Abortiporus biennis]